MRNLWSIFGSKPKPDPNTPASKLIANQPNIPAALAKVIGEHLKPHGFKRQGQSFYRTSGDLLHIINLQANKYNEREGGSFYINLAVYHERAFTLIYGESAPAMPKEYHAQLRTRLDEHSSRKQPHQWDYTAYMNIETLGDTMGTAIVDYGLSYFDGLNTAQDLLAAVGGKKDTEPLLWAHIVRGVLFGILGDTTSATGEFTAYLQQNSRANNMIRRRIACSAQDLGIQLDIPGLAGEHCVGIYFPVKHTQLINDERRARNKILLYLNNLSNKGYGYEHYWMSDRTPGMHRMAFGTTDPEFVAAYIRERADKIPLPITIKANDDF